MTINPLFCQLEWARIMGNYSHGVILKITIIGRRPSDLLLNEWACYKVALISNRKDFIFCSD